MDHDQAKRLGKFLRKRRLELALSTTQIAEQAQLNQATVVRLEQGQILSPDPDKLRNVAEALQLNLADVLALADYPIPTVLPSPSLYLRAKYRDLTSSQLRALERDVAATLKRHGIKSGSGPAAGEDEQPVPSPSQRTQTKPSSTRNKKGGSS